MKIHYHGTKDLSLKVHVPIINVTIPKGVLTAITGVAGSGKSSLMTEAFIPRNPNCIVIDQKQIGTSIRSTPATYVGIMDEIRKIFAKENCA